MKKLFIWDFVAGVVLDQITEWIYHAVISFLGFAFVGMNMMGADLLEMPWMQAIVQFFYNLAWALYLTGFVVAGFEYAIESQNGRGDLKGTLLNILKGMFAVELFSIVPVNLYLFCVTLQGRLTMDLAGITGESAQIGNIALEAMDSLMGLNLVENVIVGIFALIMMGYAVFKTFFANLKRGGILVIQIAVGSLYMFSVPRGYTDGFIQWTKQVIALCLTTFLQTTILVAGLLVIEENMLLGFGLMLSATEVPRIAQHFGLDTSTHANITQAIHTVQTVAGVGRSIGSVLVH